MSGLARPIGIDHVQITVPRERESDALFFYREVLALEERPKPEPLRKKGGAWFVVGAMELHVSIDGTSVEEHQASKRHFGLLVCGLDAWRARLEAAGYAVLEDREPIEGIERFFVRDPGGNRVEIAERAGDAATAAERL
jgi:catechol 2,3-dioxygenase-like lactoylglutathione lyase family enzyme